MVKRFLRELQRRRVLHVAGFYLAAGWLLFDVAQSVFPRLELPDWTITLVLLLLLLGFPLVVGLTWVFDITPDGIRRTGRVDRGEAPPASGLRGPGGNTRRILFNRIAVVGAIAVLAIAGGAFIVFGGHGSGEVNPDAIAVLPFTVRGGHEVDVLAEGMVELLGTKLDGVGDMRTTDPRVVLRLADRRAGPADVEGLVRRLGVGHYVLGNILEFGGTLRLEAGVYATRQPDQALATASVEGPDTSFLGLVDDLAAQLLTAGKLAPPGRMPRIAALTTESLPALKAFLEAERAIRETRFADAIPLLERAVETDSAFALAYYRMAVAAWWEERGALLAEAMDGALRHADRLGERDRALVEAFAAARAGRDAEAERRYRRIVQSHPDDVEAWYELAEVIIHRGYLLGYSPVDSRDAFEHAVALDPGHGSSLFHLSNIAAGLGERATLDSLTRALRGREGGKRDLTVEAQWAFAVGDSAAMARSLEAFEAGKTEVSAAFFAMLGAHDIAAIRSIGDAAMQGAEPAIRPFIAVTTAKELVRFGHRDEALDVLERVEARSPEPDPVFRVHLAVQPFLYTPPAELERIRERLRAWNPGPVQTSGVSWNPFRPHEALRPHARIYLLALVENRLGHPDTALRLADELERMDGVDRVRVLCADLARHVRGQVALEEGRAEEALTTIEAASFWEASPWDERVSPLFSHMASLMLRADALQELGRYREAIRWYRALATGGTEAQYGAYAHYRSAQAYEALGEPGRAAMHYAEFARLWADADPELQPLVSHVQARLAALTGETGRTEEWRSSFEW